MADVFLLRRDGRRFGRPFWGVGGFYLALGRGSRGSVRELIRLNRG
jgi:hypothetical protein